MAKEKNNKSNNKNFAKEFRGELKRVSWPSSKQMVNNVVAVISIVIVTSLIVFCLDLAFESVSNFANSKLNEKIKSQQTQVVEDNTSASEQEHNATEEGNNETSENEKNVDTQEASTVEN